MVRIAADFAHMERQGRDQVGHIRHAGLDHQIRIAHGRPEFRLAHTTAETFLHGFERIVDQPMSANVGTVTVLFVRHKNQARLFFP